MTPAGGPGRRDNGLHATDYTPVADVDPRIGEHLLEVLAVVGIAAYLQPSADQHPVTRTTTLPSRPTDRLYVDRAQRAEARRYITQLTNEGIESRPRPDTVGAGGSAQGTAARSGIVDDAEPSDQRAVPATDVDAQWQRIVDGFDTPADRADPPWPAAEDLDDSDDRSDTPDDIGDVLTRPDQSTRWRIENVDDRTRDEPTLLDALDAIDADLGPDDGTDADEGYTPPPPPPLPRISRHAVMSLAAITGGMAVFLWPQLLPMLSPNLLQILGVAAVVAGTGGLVWRLRSEPADDTDPGDGAVV